jgi:hypothetical protein
MTSFYFFLKLQAGHILVKKKSNTWFFKFRFAPATTTENDLKQLVLPGAAAINCWSIWLCKNDMFYTL